MDYSDDGEDDEAEKEDGPTKLTPAGVEIMRELRTNATAKEAEEWLTD